MTPLLAVEQVTKTYDMGGAPVDALRGVDLSLHAGEVLLLLGPSGSGKTTLLSIMGCILQATSGRVIVGGRDVARAAERDLPAVRLRHFGFVFQGFNLFPALTAAENVEVALGLKGVRGRAARAAALEALAAVDLADKAGALPANLSGDYRAAAAVAAARLADAKAALLRIRTGARPDERREVTAAVAQAEAVLAQATVEATRRAGLAAEGVLAREEADRAARDRAVAEGRLQELQARRTLVHDGPRAEDRAQAEAAVTLAAAALREAEARLAKTVIRSPIDGIVLRRDVRTGESVSPERPAAALFTVADVSRLRVRVEVDETDVGRVGAGAAGWVSASAFGDRRFPGRVIRVGQSLGRKQIFTDEPRERVDTKVLEVLLELEPGTRLPIGLRVDATIEAWADTPR